MDFISTISHIAHIGNIYKIYFKRGGVKILSEKQFFEEDNYYNGELSVILNNIRQREFTQYDRILNKFIDDLQEFGTCAAKLKEEVGNG